MSSQLCVSIVIGAITHLLWDSFTHPYGYPVQMFSLLEAPVISIGGYTLYGYRVPQHGSTLVGLSILLWLSIRWFRNTEAFGRSSMFDFRIRMLILMLIIIPSLVVGTLSGIGNIDQNTVIIIQLRAFLGEAIFSGGAILVAGLTITACVVSFIIKRGQKIVLNDHP